jgi:phage tail sheath protein FI
MAPARKSPGVERQDVFLKPQARLETGVPGFVGFAEPRRDAKPGSDAKSRKPEPGVPFALHRKIELADNFSYPANGFLAGAVAAFFDNGGERCYVVGTAGSDEAALRGGIDALAPFADLDLIVIPDAMTLRLDHESVWGVQRHAVAHCAAQGDRLAILDALPESARDGLRAQRDFILGGQTEPVNAALYYPWLRTVEGKLVPPSGAVAGVYARTDARTGVHKAPANEELTGVTDLEINIDTTIQDELNPEGINCLRAFPGRGIRVWGARTISRDPSWRYVNVRRLVLTLRRWIALNMAWTGFEPNAPLLWIRIERELRGYLTGLWRAGALTGDTPDAAFYVKCDTETNPPELRDLGEVVTEIGLAPNPPAEFVVIRVTQREGVADLLPR